jgi:CHASE3 domain sensor protein
MTFSNKAIAGCTTVILLGVGVFSFLSAVREGQDRGWVTHTHLVIEKLQTVLIDIDQAEAGQRGYLLTGGGWYVGEYEADLNQVREDLKGLRDLTSDNPKQQEAIQRLEPIIAARLAELGDGIEVRRRTGAAPVLGGENGTDGKEFTGGIRAQVGEMRSTEEQLLVSRLETADGGTRKAKAIIVIGNALAILILLVAGFVTDRAYVRHSLTEQELKRVTEHLEHRTAGLLEANRPNTEAALRLRGPRREF